MIMALLASSSEGAVFSLDLTPEGLLTASDSPVPLNPTPLWYRKDADPWKEKTEN